MKALILAAFGVVLLAFGTLAFQRAAPYRHYLFGKRAAPCKSECEELLGFLKGAKKVPISFDCEMCLETKGRKEVDMCRTGCNNTIKWNANNLTEIKTCYGSCFDSGSLPDRPHKGDCNLGCQRAKDFLNNNDGKLPTGFSCNWCQSPSGIRQLGSCYGKCKKENKPLGSDSRQTCFGSCFASKELTAKALCKRDCQKGSEFMTPAANFTCDDRCNTAREVRKVRSCHFNCGIKYRKHHSEGNREFCHHSCSVSKMESDLTNTNCNRYCAQGEAILRKSKNKPATGFSCDKCDSNQGLNEVYGCREDCKDVYGKYTAMASARNICYGNCFISGPIAPGG